MVPIMSLLLPILLSGVVVFLASFVIHMVLPFHRSDYRKLPAEDGVMDALRPFSIPPGDYMMPNAGSPAAMKDPAFLARWNKGPLAVITVLKPGPMSMKASLAQWFLYCVVVSVFAAFIAGRALAPGATLRAIFKFAGCTTFVGYTLALWQETIWYKKAWTTTFRSTVDGLVYALLTAGVFGMLWPK
jgi:hypothetical protein